MQSGRGVHGGTVWKRDTRQHVLEEACGGHMAAQSGRGARGDVVWKRGVQRHVLEEAHGGRGAT